MISLSDISDLSDLSKIQVMPPPLPVPPALLQPMLIRNTKLTEQQFSRLYGMIGQPKLDGIRITICSSQDNFGNTYTFVRTRGNKMIRKDLEEWVLQNFIGLPTNIFIDCELIYDNDCAATAGIAHSIHTKLDYDKLQLFVFDAVNLYDWQQPLDIRLLKNKAIINVPYWKHTSFDDSYQRAEQFADSHGLVFEGFVLKPAKSTYQFGKRLEGSYKYKLQAEMDCIIDRVVQMEDAQGNTKPLAGYFVCHPINSPNTSLNVTASCSNELRKVALEQADKLNGKAIITIRYMDVPSGKLSNGLVRMPRYISGLEYLLDEEGEK